MLVYWCRHGDPSAVTWREGHGCVRAATEDLTERTGGTRQTGGRGTKTRHRGGRVWEGIGGSATLTLYRQHLHPF